MSYHKSNNEGCLELVLLAIFAIATIVSGIVFETGNRQEFTGTIVKTYIDRGNTYFVIQKEGEQEIVPYKNEDSWLNGKLNSGDFLMQLEVGKTYKFTSVGWRIPWLSMFQNLIRFENTSPE